MKKQIIFSLALCMAFFTTTFMASAQEAPAAKKADKKEKSKKEKSDNDWGWSTNGWGGERVVGTGDVITETRDVKDFTGVSSSISADIDLRQSSTFKVTIDGQKNVLDLLETEVKDGRLKISFKKGYSIKYKNALKVHIDAPNFTYLGMAGSGNVESNGTLSGEKLDISISGSGDFNLKTLQYTSLKAGISGSGNVDLGGTAENAELTISGSGDLKAKELKAQSVRCRVSGSGNVSCFVTKDLDALVSGSGDIRYSGSPASVKKKVSGSGSVEAR
jgi:Putative auto-transporter adhesin, head GIN domain